MLYKPSAYNVHLPGGAVFNTVSGSFVKPTEQQLDWLDQRFPLTGDAEPPEAFTALRQGGFVMPDEAREALMLKARWYEAVTSDRAPTLTIAPTMNCNFGCDYCFESHEPGIMSVEVRTRLEKFITTQLAAQAAYPLHVTWFGGEPLMGLSAILDLSDRFDRLVDQGVLSDWSAFMITNGHLLTPKTVKRLEGRRISGFQITIDGPREIHDMRRVLKAGRKATFDTICGNIVALPEPYEVSIRVNVDRRNATELEQLAHQLWENGVLRRPGTSLYLANVENYDRPDLAETATVLSNREFAAVQQRFLRFCTDHGYPCSDEGVSTSLQGVCQVDNVNAFVVDSDGSLMKCWAELRNRPQVVAHLCDESTWPEPVLSSFEDRDPFDDDECMSCPVLPLCMGACPKLREMRRNFDFKMCPPIKHCLTDVLQRKASEMDLDAGHAIQDRTTQLKELAR